MAERMIQAYDFDLAFIGASGIEPAYGTTTFNELTQLSQSMANAAKQVVIMAESSKLNNKMPNHELPWSKISTFITDNQLTQGSKQTIQTQGVNLLCTQN
jgi:DeoR/GlpR family transcriptional regulator of sugar metabolism